MNSKNLTITSIFILLISLPFISSVIVDADYITIFPGEEGRVVIEIENNEDFDIEDVSVQILLAIVLPDGTHVPLPFTMVGSSEKDIDDIDEDDDDTVSFTLRSSSDIEPGDYNIPYLIKYVNEDDRDEEFEQTGVFGLRVSAKTELDFSAEVRGNAIVGEEGQISLEIINEGLGEIKSVSVKINPQGFELLSKDKIFVGSIDADDTDIATFDVIYKSKNPILSTIVTYKDFDNNEQTQVVSLPIKVYTREEALELGIIKENRTGLYIGIAVFLIIAYIIYRRIKKRRKNKIKGR